MSDERVRATSTALAMLMEDLEFQSAIVRDVTNECRISNGLGDLHGAQSAMSLLRHRVSDIQALWSHIMREYESLGVRSLDVSHSSADSPLRDHEIRLPSEQGAGRNPAPRSRLI